KGAEDGTNSPDTMHPTGACRPRLCRIKTCRHCVHPGVGTIQTSPADEGKQTKKCKAGGKIAHRHGDKPPNAVNNTQRPMGINLIHKPTGKQRTYRTACLIKGCHHCSLTYSHSHLFYQRW